MAPAGRRDCASSAEVTVPVVSRMFVWPVRACSTGSTLIVSPTLAAWTQTSLPTGRGNGRKPFPLGQAGGDFLAPGGAFGQHPAQGGLRECGGGRVELPDHRAASSCTAISAALISARPACQLSGGTVMGAPTASVPWPKGKVTRILSQEFSVTAREV